MNSLQRRVLHIITISSLLFGMILLFAFGDSNAPTIHAVVLFSLITGFIGLILISFIALNQSRLW